MKGSRRFSHETAQQIRTLLADVRRADRATQKNLRQRIRKLDFYISDFNRPIAGFRPDDFDELVRAGKIEII